jgi:hypothetical protein
MLDNIELPINSEKDLYTSVVSAWDAALIATDTLLKGIPQQIQNGAALLGISSWHLFPDLEVLGVKTVGVNQKDDLFQPTAVLTLGLQFENREDREQKSVSWSLPLSRMKYYGDPIISQQVLGRDNSRITMTQFGFVILGAIFAGWGVYGQSVESGLTWISKLDAVSSILGTSHSVGWLRWILEVGKSLSNSSGTERQVSMQLVALGRRRSEELCPQSIRPAPFFGLADPLVLINIVSNKNLRIRIMRFIAKSYGLIIRVILYDIVLLPIHTLVVALMSMQLLCPCARKMRFN